MGSVGHLRIGTIHVKSYYKYIGTYNRFLKRKWICNVMDKHVCWNVCDGLEWNCIGECLFGLDAEAEAGLL